MALVRIDLFLEIKDLVKLEEYAKLDKSKVGFVIRSAIADYIKTREGV